MPDFGLIDDAFISGIISAVSLPMGAIIALLFRPSRTVTSAIMAFGSGALLAAVSFELLEPALEHGGIVPLAIGFTIGAVTYVIMNGLLDQSGGFLRKGATVAKFLRRQKEDEVAGILEHLSRVELMRALPAEEIQGILPHIESILVPAGSTIVQAGADDYSLYLLVAGELDVFADGDAESAAPLRQFAPGEAFGEVALLTGEPRQTTVRARTEAQLLRLPKDDFDELVELSPSLAASVEDLAAQRLERAETSSASEGEAQLAARRWHKLAKRTLRHAAVRGDVSDEKRALSQRAGAAAVGIYLGLFLDGMPESLSIGALINEHSSFNYALIVALFLSNLPEAMGSSVLMRAIGYSPLRIISLWGGLMLFTGVGAALGQVMFAGASPFVLSIIFALAAGAMLAMLAETAMPEAYEQGGWVVGITTVLGFLAAYWMKTFE